MRVSYAIVFVSDMKRSVAFYRDTLDIPLRFETPGWTEFDTGGTTLALHLSDEPSVPGGDSDHLPAGRCRWGFCVPDLNGFHVKMTERGVPCAQEPKEVFGARIAQYADPDGMGFSVSEERQSP